MYYRRTVHKGGRNRLLALTAVVLLLLFADIVSGGVVRAYVRAGAASAWRWTGGAVVDWVGAIVSSRASLEAQNRVLASQLSQTTEEAGMVALLQEQNDQLRALVHLAQEVPGITAPVVSSLSASPYGTFLIGVGNGESVSKGDLVLTGGGFVVGRINDTGSGTALVSEILAPGASLEATLDGATVTVQGQGGGNGRTQAPRGLAVAVGDVVVVPLFGQRGIAVVGAVASSSTGASQDVYVRLPIGLSQLQFVYVTPANK